MKQLMKNFNKILCILLIAVFSTSIFAEVEEDDAEEAIEKAADQIKRLADKKSKYQDFVTFPDVSPVLSYLKQAKAQKEDGQYHKSFIHATMAWVYGVVAMDRAKSRFYKNAADQFYLDKYGKEIKKQKLNLNLSSAGLKKKGAVYKGQIGEDKIFEYSRRRWTEKISSTGGDILKKISLVLKDYPKSSVRIDYGLRWDRSGSKSTERVDYIKKYLTDQLGIKEKQIKAEGVGKKFRKDVIEFTISGIK
jgi:hypothetical protein